MIEDDPQLLDSLTDHQYKGRPERAILFQVNTWDVNCPQHIHRRFPQSAVAPIIEDLQNQITDLKSRLAKFEQE